MYGPSLRLTAVGAQFASLAEEAAQRSHSHLHYLEALLQAESEDRERRRIHLTAGQHRQMTDRGNIGAAHFERRFDSCCPLM